MQRNQGLQLDLSSSQGLSVYEPSTAAVEETFSANCRKLDSTSRELQYTQLRCRTLEKHLDKRHKVESVRVESDVGQL